MKFLQYAFLAVFLLGVPMQVSTVHAESIPNITGNSGTLKSKMKTAGSNVFEIIAYAVFIMSILAIVVAAGFAVARRWSEAVWGVAGALVGVLIAGSAYAIAQLGAVN
jgi:hypothetical protein